MATFLDNAGVRETVFSAATAAVTPAPGTAVALTVPDGATVVQINVIRLTGPSTVLAAHHKIRAKRLIASVYRKAPRGQALHVPLDRAQAAPPQARPLPDRGPRRQEPRRARPATKRILTVKAPRKAKR